jgi:hypothetical protein
MDEHEGEQQQEEETELQISRENQVCASACLCGFLVWCLFLGIWEAMTKK